MPNPEGLLGALLDAQKSARQPQSQPVETMTETAPQAEEKAAQIVTFKAIAKRQGLIIGIGAASGSVEKLDKDGEFVDKADMVRMAHDFTSTDKRVFKVNHEDEIDAKLVRSWPGAPEIADADAPGGRRTLKAGEVLTDEMHVVGIDLIADESHWFVGTQLPQSLADKADAVVGYSFGAAVTKREV